MAWYSHAMAKEPRKLTWDDQPATLSAPAPASRRPGRPRNGSPSAGGAHLPSAPNESPSGETPEPPNAASTTNSSDSGSATDVLTASLQPWAAAGTAARVASEPIVTLDLATADDAVLLEEDVAALNRVTYVVSLLRLNKFLRRDTSLIFAEEEAQAKVAVAYIRNLESNRLGALQIGRSASDLHLADEVRKMRAEMADIADKRAESINRKRRGRPPAQT